jgi:hypothetical protein
MSKAKELLSKVIDSISEQSIDETNPDKLNNLVTALRKAKFMYQQHKEHGTPFGHYRRNVDNDGEVTKHHVEVYKGADGHTYTRHEYDGKHKDSYPVLTHNRLKALKVISE